jgi:hemerythrin
MQCVEYDEVESDQSLSMDIEEIDNQHKSLIEIIYFFESCVKAPDRHEICFEDPVKLINYFDKHLFCTT